MSTQTVNIYADVPDYRCLQEVTPKLIAGEVSERCPLMYKLVSTITEKPKDSEGGSDGRVGAATSVLMNLRSQKMSVYATKIGVSLVASGKTTRLLYQ